MKRFIFLFGIAFFFYGMTPSEPPAVQNHLNTIVIDAGHGGKDPGAVGKKSYEKDHALAMALLLGKKIETAFPDVKVIYTRKTDVYVQLWKRASIANKANADLFISIHCNANDSPKPYGAETFVMGLHKSSANLSVAKKENSVILLEEDYSAQYDGYDPDSPEAHIIFSLFQNAYLEQSAEFANLIQNNFKNECKRHNRGVKQAGFLVLYKTAMPGVLIETGFISNLEEEKYLMSKKGQDELTAAMFDAFCDYKYQLDGIKPNQEPIPENNKNTENQQTEETSNLNKAGVNEKGVVFKVQFWASPDKVSLSSSRFNELQEVGMYEHNGLFKYTSGNASSLDQAKKLQSEVRNSGYPDAFIVAFHKNERISTQRAIELLNQP